MVRLLLLALAVATVMAATAEEKFTLDPRWAEETKADFLISYSPWSNKLNIGILEFRDFERVKGGVPSLIDFTFGQLTSFWKAQRHKEWIVVVVEKWDPTDEQQKVLVRNLTDYFFDVGFRRVLIRQGAGGLGYNALSDATNPNAFPPPPPR